MKFGVILWFVLDTRKHGSSDKCLEGLSWPSLKRYDRMLLWGFDESCRSIFNGLRDLIKTPYKNRQGDGHNTKYSATSRNSARKKYRGQGKPWVV